ncbi:TetR/AcrR family transcriptional regulator [Salisediminibacterium selenitireducens]|uniref:Transcriptional regulator, TetR family n=1 Tax=Bacillus selenitireducens (strain ATCC 700615 / DSM 15326 / MLS10) TaxID=439292 RepID=D6XZ44_BACIE|nr:TetR/AcrR family transcriptional regulator [Salisediminibacterium selenitireducens]ADI00329.1 transcriptional regulator, TetR family [[Bacillus] selenitireducens MLS10]
MKERITAKALELFEQKGFAETSIREIVDALGISKGAFYHYFAAKDEILSHLHMAYIDTLVKEQADTLRDASLSSEEKLRRIIDLLIRNIEPNGANARVFFREMRHLSEDHLAAIIPKRDQFLKQLHEVLDEGVRRGVFRSGMNTELQALAIIGACNWSYQWFRPDGPIPAHAVTASFYDLFVHGLKNG